MKQEQASLKPAPGISHGSKKLLESIEKLKPIYSNERRQQINTNKKMKLEKLKSEFNKEKEIKQKREQLSISIPLNSYRASSVFVKESDLAFNPKSVRSIVYDKPLTKPHFALETSEEKEIRKNCTFKPATDQKSTKLFTMKNTMGKPVVDRLLDFAKVKEEHKKEILEEIKPSFTPRINKKIGFEPVRETSRISFAPQPQNVEQIFDVQKNESNNENRVTFKAEQPPTKIEEKVQESVVDKLIEKVPTFGLSKKSHKRSNEIPSTSTGKKPIKTQIPQQATAIEKLKKMLNTSVPDKKQKNDINSKDNSSAVSSVLAKYNP